MKIAAIDVIPYRIPNRAVHKIATLTLSALENTIVRIRTDDGTEGVGEAVSEAKWNSTVLEAHHAVLERYLAPALIGLDPLDVAAVWRAMDRVVNGHLSAKSAIDVAIHDLIGRALGIPVWKLLGGAVTREVPVEGPGFGIGFMEPDAAAAFAWEAASRGCREIEVKCGSPLGWRRDYDVIRAVYDRCGPDVRLKIDVTEAYTFRIAADALPKFAAHGVDWVEQPLPRGQLADLARLRQIVPCGILVEESVGGPEDVLRVAELGAADGLHLKLPMLGGFTMARRIATICQAVGMGVQSGSSTPSGLGLAATHQFAATLPNRIRGCHGSPLARATDDLLREPVDAYAAVVHVSDRPGLGVEVDWAKVDRYRVSTGA